MKPTWFGPTDRPLFGWIHQGKGDVGVVVCNPFGYEAVCAHRTLRHLASLGVPSIRFDYDGTGDSAGDDRDSDRVPAWIRSIGLAIDELKKETGVGRVVLLGVRLGALLAASAAAGRDDVESLIAIAPVVSGRAYARETKLLQMALGLGEPPAGIAIESGVQEALGFVVTDETKAALSKLDLSKMTLPRALILDRADLPSAFAAREGVEVRAVRGYVEMVLDPHKAEVPTEILAGVASWLGRDGIVAKGALDGEAETTIEGVKERAVRVGNGLFGILTTPVGGGRTEKAIVLLNAGSVHHIGPNRLHVVFARRWASLGYSVLRLDNAGVGDSPSLAGRPENVVYAEKAVDDMIEGARYLGDRASSVIAMGLCSGAYHAFKGALAGAPVDSIVLVNPLTFDWRPGMSLDYPAHKVAQDVERYGDAVMQVDKWKKVLRGEVHLKMAAKTMAKHATGVARVRVRDLARRLGRPFADDLGAALEAIVERGIGIRFVFAEGDPGQPLLRTQAGSALPKLREAGAIRIDVIEGPDHTFTPVWSHTLLWNALR